MAANQKQGGKNRKLGRHSRNPSSKLQAARTLANGKKRIARHLKRMGFEKPGILTAKEVTRRASMVPRGTARAKRRAKLYLQFGTGD